MKKKMEQEHIRHHEIQGILQEKGLSSRKA